MPSVTETAIPAIYKLAKRVYEKEGSDEKIIKEATKDAVDILVNVHHMNKASAIMYIKFFLCMMRGEAYDRSINNTCLRYYCENVLHDYGGEQLKIFLKGLEEYIKYRHRIGHKVPGFYRLHNEFSEKIGQTPIYDSPSQASNVKVSNVKVSHGLMIGRPLKDSWQVPDLTKYKIHFAKKNQFGEPLDLCAEDPYEWQSWQEYHPLHNDFNRQYIFSLLNYYTEEKMWLFGGVFEVLGEKNGKYEVQLTDQLKEYVGRLKLSSPHNSSAIRINFETEYANFVVEEIFDKPFFTIAKDSNLTYIEDDTNDIDVKKGNYSIASIVEDGCFIEQDKLEEILENLKNKKNLILQGPPGTGKTWLAKRLGYTLIGEKDRNKIMAVQFHPNMSYEDFIMGYRPNNKIELNLIKGAFLKFADKAAENADENYVMVIEEINRGNPAQIFGEILTLLEADKRNQDEALHLCYQDEDGSPIFIPENIYLIGTMNLADRSLAVVDFALRRRFAFVNLEPELNQLWYNFTQEKFDKDKDFVKEIQARMQKLNDKIKNDHSLGKQFCIGHSFITPTKKISEPKTWFKRIVESEIKPLLEEYWFDSIETSENSENSKTKTDSAIEELLSGL